MLTKIEISHRTIIFTVLFILSIWVLFQIRQIILLVYISSILMIALNPLVTFLEKLKIPRFLAILFCYFFFLSVFSLVIGSFLPLLIDQTRNLFEQARPYIASFDLINNQSTFNNQINHQLNLLPEKSLKLIAGIFSNLVSVFVLLVVAFYLLMERKKLSRYLFILFGSQGQKRAAKIIDKIEVQLGGWVRGQTTLCIVVGLMTYIGLWFLGIEFALPLALLAGILEIVPNIGPVLSAVPAVLFSLATSSVSALAIVALYFLVQQIENYLIVPSIMKRAVHLSPLIIILSLMIGIKIGGIWGALLAVPTVLILRVLVLEISSSKNFRES